MKLAGNYEMCKALCISKQAFANWRQRSPLLVPEPLANLRMSPVWDLDDPKVAQFILNNRKATPPDRGREK